jgi:hypothetical protein
MMNDKDRDMDASINIVTLVNLLAGSIQAVDNLFHWFLRQ